MEYKSAVFRNTIRATFAITVATIIAYFIPYNQFLVDSIRVILIKALSIS